MEPKKEFKPDISDECLFRIDYTLRYSGIATGIPESMLIASEEWPTINMMRNAVSSRTGFFRADISDKLVGFDIVSCSTAGNIWRVTS